jgi:hypothetical protein
VTFVDETTAGERRTAWGLEIAEERLTVRELIRRRVFQEVAEDNARTPRRIEPETQTALGAGFRGERLPGAGGGPSGH